MSDPLQISAKNLAQLAMPGFCSRCFWIRLHHPRMPYSIFPGVFSSIDIYGKRVTSLLYEKSERPPQWLEMIGASSRPLPVPHRTKFQIWDRPTNISLTGVPDGIWQRADRSLAIVDEKTAKVSAAQDALAPLYAGQLNCYGYIAERVGLGMTSWLGLEYYQPVTDIDGDELDNVTDVDSIYLRFSPKVIPVEIDMGAIPLLLGQARQIYDLSEPPPGRNECKDCRLLTSLIGLVTTGNALIEK